METPTQLKKIKTLYSDNLNKFGVQSKAVGWKTTDCQELRFKQICKLFQGTLTPFELLDYGCGFGSIASYIHQKSEFKLSAYHGYDISKEMLDEARHNLAQENFQVKLFNDPEITTQADYGVVSGTFNVKFDATKDDWKNFISRVLNSLNSNCRKGFAFNLLSTYVDWQEPHLFYGDPCFWFDFCKTHFSKQVTLLHDYPLWEWTILVKKDF